jgi:acetoin utilization deacetylase AcuC-like enzyme
MGAGHPECPQRIQAIEDQLRAQGLDALMLSPEVPLASNEDLALAHDLNYVLTLDDFLQQLEATGDTRALDPDTWACPGTRSATWRAAGAAIAATDAVIDGALDNAFCAVRPPGHHAPRGQTMGFCFFNNVDVAARHALDVRGLQRVEVVDFDVHHGNGTEDILAGDERVLMVRIFQHPFYPYSGFGEHAANMVNVPVPAYTKGPAIRELIEKHWLPRLEAFRP